MDECVRALCSDIARRTAPGVEVGIKIVKKRKLPKHPYAIVTIRKSLATTLVECCDAV